MSAQDHAQAVKWYRKPPNRGTLTLSSASARRTAMARACRRTTHRRSPGPASLPNRGTLTLSSTSAAMYRDGLGMSPDYAQAVAWFRKAADQGQSGSADLLGVMYGEGQGVAPDYSQALIGSAKPPNKGTRRRRST